MKTRALFLNRSRNERRGVLSTSQFQYSILVCVVSTLLFPLVLHSIAKDNRIKTIVDHSSITIGDPVTLRLEVRHSRQQKVEFLSPGSRLGKWTVRTFQNLGSKTDASEWITDILVLTLTIYQTGEFEIPSLEVQIINREGSTELLMSEPIKIAVRSVLTDNTDALKGLKKQAEIATDYKPFLLFLVTLGAAVLLIYRLVNRWKGRHQSASLEMVPAVPPDQQARLAIHQLLTRKLTERGLVKEFYLELSEIIKRYLGAELSIQALERTTKEFTGDMRSMGVSMEILHSVRDFLTDCDQVKFAKYHPSDAEIVRIIDESLAIVDAASRQSRKTAEIREVPV